MGELNTISIIIPVYNEQNTIAELIQRLANIKLTVFKEVIIVNDGSIDNTEKNILAATQAYTADSTQSLVYLKKENGGKGSALKLGYQHSKGDILFCLDADLELYPEDIPSLLNAFLEDRNIKVVYGSRILGKNERNATVFYFGGRMVSLLTSILFNCTITDQPTGFKIFHKELLPILLGSQYGGFEWEAEITAKVLKAGYTIKEVPVRYSPRTVGKKLRWKDGIKIVWILLKYRIVNT